MRRSLLFKGLRCELGRRSMSTVLSKGLRAKIQLSGPITLAEYMREVLTRPQQGYYMNKDVFGTKGDFITSPEISQLFGELIGVWSLNEWHKFNFPRPFQLVELGPGRGTMMQDILRVSHFYPIPRIEKLICHSDQSFYNNSLFVLMF
jgi:SAM-dependent MidA family methyltransferase